MFYSKRVIYFCAVIITTSLTPHAKYLHLQSYYDYLSSINNKSKLPIDQNYVNAIIKKAWNEIGKTEAPDIWLFNALYFIETAKYLGFSSSGHINYDDSYFFYYMKLYKEGKLLSVHELKEAWREGEYDKSITKLQAIYEWKKFLSNAWEEIIKYPYLFSDKLPLIEKLQNELSQMTELKREINCCLNLLIIKNN